MVEHARRKATGRRPTFARADAAHPPIRAASVDVVLCRHVLWALPDPGAALRRWASLLAPDGQLVLVEGRWSTGAGLDAAHARTLVEPIAHVAAVRVLDDPRYWGKDIDDERYLLVARRRSSGPS
jgi:SAM-dependent methyltransferase